jgi:hypothetical protein
VERVGALHRVRASFGDDLGDPVRLIGRNMGDHRATFGAEQVEELPQRGPISSRPGHTRRPESWSTTTVM